jgi:predicted transcriptional regulator of viral defense system
MAKKPRGRKRSMTWVGERQNVAAGSLERGRSGGTAQPEYAEGISDSAKAACPATSRCQAGRFERRASFVQRLTHIAAQRRTIGCTDDVATHSREDKRPSVSPMTHAGKPIHRWRHEVIARTTISAAQAERGGRNGHQPSPD